MAVRRPVVSVAGEKRQLPEGDFVVGLPLSTTAYQQSGLALRVKLTPEYSLPVGALRVPVALDA